MTEDSVVGDRPEKDSTHTRNTHSENSYTLNAPNIMPTCLDVKRTECTAMERDLNTGIADHPHYVRTI